MTSDEEHCITQSIIMGLDPGTSTTQKILQPLNINMSLLAKQITTKTN